MRIEVKVPFEFYRYLSGLSEPKVKYVDDGGKPTLVFEWKDYLFYIKQYEKS